MDTAYSLIMLLGDPAATTAALSSNVMTWLVPLSMFVAGAFLPSLRRKLAPVRPDGVAELRAVGLSSYKRMSGEFRRELERGRRYDRSLAIVVMKLDDAHVEHELLGKESESDLVVACGRQVIFAHVGHILRDYLRGMDVAACDLPNRRYVLLLPEQRRTEALGTVKRLSELIAQGTGANVRAGVAEFDADGLVIEDLVAVAAARCDQPRLELAGNAAGTSVDPLPPISKLSVQR